MLRIFLSLSYFIFLTCRSSLFSLSVLYQLYVLKMVSPSLCLFFSFSFCCLLKNTSFLFNVAELLMRTKQPKHKNSTGILQETKLLTNLSQEHKCKNYKKKLTQLPVRYMYIHMDTYKYTFSHLTMAKVPMYCKGGKMTFSKIVLSQLDLPTVGKIS